VRAEVLQIALIAGAFTWAFRFLPTRADLARLAPHGLLARLLTALGPAAITALFVAEVSPALVQPLAGQGPLAAGVLGTVLTYAATRSVVGATLAGSAAYGVLLALFP
jgi:branched-subunit amino acid transport protein